jgi:hypothetical protein
VDADVNTVRTDKLYEVWYFYGDIKREKLKGIPGLKLDTFTEDREKIPVIVTLVNDSIIKVSLNPLDSGAFPYRTMSWSRRPGYWAGVGVAEIMSTPQRLVNAATRALLNNAGLSAGVQIIIDQMGVVPADNSWKLTPNKIWYKTGESMTQDVREAFHCEVIPSVQKEMMAIIEYGMRLAEESTGIPLVTQGQPQGPTSPQTFGEAEMQNNNSLTWLRSIGHGYDDQVQESLVDALYEWLLLDPDVPDEEKGEFEIDAQGSSALVERAIQEQTLLAMFSVAGNPAFNVDQGKLFTEYLRAKRLDPRRIQLTGAQIAARNAQPPVPPVEIQVEQMRGQNALAVAKERTNTVLQQVQAEAAHEQNMLQTGGTTPHMANAMARIHTAQIQAASRERSDQIHAQAELAYVEREREIARDNNIAAHQERQDKLQLAMLDYANKRNITLEQLKAELAKTSMQEQTKRQLAQAQIALTQSEGHQDRLVDVHKHHTKLVSDQNPPAPIEPPGQAPAGESFAK